MRQRWALMMAVAVPVAVGGAAGSVASRDGTTAGPGPEPPRPGRLVQLTSDPADEVEPKWSPDGRLLSFASNRGGRWNVWLVDSTGGAPRALTTDLEMVHSTWWSPDGRRLAIAAAVATPDGYAGTVEALDLASGRREPLTRGGPVDGAPCWSPDGRRLAFVSNRSGNWDIWVVDLATGEESLLVTHEAFDHSPRWSPDGTRIAFHSARSGNGDIWLLSLADGGLTRLTDSDALDHFPTWSPDGRFVAFHSNRAGSFDIWVVPASGGEAVQLTSGPGNDTRPAWSPDGTRIAFGSDRTGSSDIWVLELEPGFQKGHLPSSARDTVLSSGERHPRRRPRRPGRSGAPARAGGCHWRSAVSLGDLQVSMQLTPGRPFRPVSSPQAREGSP